jgi:hypothetical protein
MIGASFPPQETDSTPPRTEHLYKQIVGPAKSAYALGYRQLTGDDADLLTICNLDDQVAGNVREAIDQDLINTTRQRIVDAGNSIRSNTFPCTGDCAKCDFKGICGRA